MDKQRIHEVPQWLFKANHDLRSAEKIMSADNGESLLDTAVYHCQQAARKALEAYLKAHGITFLETHFLSPLSYLPTPQNTSAGCPQASGKKVKRRHGLFLLQLSILLFITGSPLSLTAKEIPENYIYETVRGPIVDGIRLGVPKELGNQILARDGLVDVTAAPFHADPTGKKDSTEAIQKAINYARDHQMVCFFPSGTYMISDTLSCIQNYYQRTTGKIFGANLFPCVLVGSRKGKRPEIYLKSRSKGFMDPKRPKYLIHFWARSLDNSTKPQPNISMNQLLVNIDIRIGEGNRGAIAVRHRGAQGSGIQESLIDVTHGLTGIEGGCGSGGSHVDVTIIGGEIGLDLRETQPSTSVTNIRLFNQKKHAILYAGRQSLTAVGVKINATSNKWPAIKGFSPGNSPSYGQICLIDSEITLNGKKPGTAISTTSSLYLENVFIKGTGKAIEFGDGTGVDSNDSSWLQVIQLAKSGGKKSLRGYKYSSGIWIKQKKEKSLYKLLSKTTQPDNLQKRHSWKNERFSWENGAVNVKAPPYNAKGDGLTDDTASIQKALDENEAVFLPKGYYLLSRPLSLHDNSRLIGIARHLSILVANFRATAFSNPDLPQPLIRASGPTPQNTLIYALGLYVPKLAVGSFALLWTPGVDGIIRDVYFFSQPPPKGFLFPGEPHPKNFPFVYIKGGTGGSLWNFSQGDYAYQGPQYRHILIEDTKKFKIYQCNVETARSNANMEFNNVRDIELFGLKGEGNIPLVLVQDSENVRILGYGGNAAARRGNALFVIRDSSNILLVNLVDSPRISKKNYSKRVGPSTTPDLWHMVEEWKGGKKTFQTEPQERPVLYLSN